MAATFQWCEDNGAATGTPAKGTTRTGFSADANYPADCNWKNVDDCRTAGGVGTLYSASPITAGSNSFTKYQYGKFTGTFNLISSAIWGHTAGALGTGLTLKGAVTSTYATPSTVANATLTTDMTAVVGTFASGQTGVLNVNFSTTGPEAASPTATLSAAGYTQYLATQLQTTSSAAAGDTAQATLTLQYNEN